jgi:hypothetical protein
VPAQQRTREAIDFAHAKRDALQSAGIAFDGPNRLSRRCLYYRVHCNHYRSARSWPTYCNSDFSGHNSRDRCLIFREHARRRDDCGESPSTWMTARRRPPTREYHLLNCVIASLQR